MHTETQKPEKCLNKILNSRGMGSMLPMPIKIIMQSSKNGRINYAAFHHLHNLLRIEIFLVQNLDYIWPQILLCFSAKCAVQYLFLSTIPTFHKPLFQISRAWKKPSYVCGGSMTSHIQDTNSWEIWKHLPCFQQSLT